MEINTKFQINDLVQHKFQKQHKPSEKLHGLSAYEVLEIQTQTCMAGTQVFYLCRGLYCIYHKDWDTNALDLSDIAHGNNPEHPFTKFREDELKPCQSDIAAKITGEINE